MNFRPIVIRSDKCIKTNNLEKLRQTLGANQTVFTSLIYFKKNTQFSKLNKTILTGHAASKWRENVKFRKKPPCKFFIVVFKIHVYHTTMNHNNIAELSSERSFERNDVSLLSDSKQRRTMLFRPSATVTAYLVGRLFLFFIHNIRLQNTLVHNKRVFKSSRLW